LYFSILACAAAAPGIELGDGGMRAEPDLDAEADEEQLAALIRLAERCCVISRPCACRRRSIFLLQSLVSSRLTFYG